MPGSASGRAGGASGKGHDATYHNPNILTHAVPPLPTLHCPFQVFINVHVFGFMLFTLFALMHDPSLVNYALPPLLLYGLDRAFRCVMRLRSAWIALWGGGGGGSWGVMWGLGSKVRVQVL